MKCTYEINAETGKVGNVNITLESKEERSVMLLALMNYKTKQESLVSVLSDGKSKQYETEKLNNIIKVIEAYEHPETKHMSDKEVIE